MKDQAALRRSLAGRFPERNVREIVDLEPVERVFQHHGGSLRADPLGRVVVRTGPE